jgi:hypothetical protein
MRRKIFSFTAIFALIFSLAFSIGGCAKIQNAVNSAQGVLCNPTDQQKTEAAAGAAAVDGLLAILQIVPQTSTIADLIVSLGGAKITFGTIQSGGCVAITALAQALDAVDQADAVQKNLMTAKAIFSPVVIPAMQSLRNAVN